MEEQAQIELVKAFSNAHGAPGFEREVVKLFKQQMAGRGDTTVDGMFNALTARAGNTGKRPVIQLDAHSDSVGLLVQAIRPNGLIKFVTLGGWVPTNIPAMKVQVRNQLGEYVTGVVATKPPHFMTAEERKQVPTVADMSIDVGTSSREETINQLHINTGCPIFPAVECEYLPNQGMFFGKDFDNRVGAAALVETFDQLSQADLAVDVVASLSAQEEVGLRGAYVTARKVNPDLAIVFEGCPADDTFEPDWLSQTRVKGGPMLRDMDTSFIANPLFEQFAADTAERIGIPYTRAVRTGGGVDGAAITYWQGAPTIVIGIPVRYEHTAFNWTALSDFQAATKLAAALIADMTPERIASFTQVDD
ncbi:M42 family metallopeptidase [Lacticaseibacillus nasuensis]|uniref:Peptidase M42 family n=1 Tax=Lacticaseibacillus nasuensis JCM 17158 TaxID=1291734 RepID=A0A0R1JIN4_9LACO|nr:M42 family peptidase [Lacticaseibacillus nasuensis]KRK71020.1 peptidase M42 family [Lacticaseibacillus nasuensis JCM 17158]